MRQMQGSYLSTLVAETPGATVLILLHRPSGTTWWYLPKEGETREVASGQPKPLPDRDRKVFQLLGTLP